MAVVGHTPNDGELDDVAGTVAGDGVGASMMVVGQEGPCQTEQQNNYACHQTDANMGQRGPCDVDHECDLCYDSCKDDGEGYPTIHHLPSCGSVTCEGVAESPHDRHLVVASRVHDASSPAA